MATATEADSKTAARITRNAATVDARIAERDAKSSRRLREREAKIELRRREAEAARAEREATLAAREERRGRRAERRQAKRQARAKRAAAVASRLYSFVAGNMPAVYSSGIYGMALYVAVTGQISMATERGWPVVFGIGMAVFLEGLALSMALTAHQQRLKGERALTPRVLTWVAAGFAAAVNFIGHADDLVMATVLGASSLAAITVWEVRSGAKHRDVLRRMGLIPEPPERFGLRRWFRYPRSTFAAWSLDVRSRVGTGAARLLAEVEARRAEIDQDRANQDARDAQWGALAVALSAAQDAQVAKAVAVDAVKAASRRPRPGRWRWFNRSKTPAPSGPGPSAPVNEPAPEPRPKERPAPRPAAPRPVKKAAPKPAPTNQTEVSGDGFEAVEEAFVRIYRETGKRPGARALASAQDAKKRSTIHDWMTRNPGRVRELTVRAEAERTAALAGQREQETTSV